MRQISAEHDRDIAGKNGRRRVIRFSLIFVLFVLGGIAWLVGFNILKFIKYIKEELLIVLGTSSSESVLPRMIAKLENLGCKESVVGLVPKDELKKVLDKHIQ